MILRGWSVVPDRYQWTLYRKMLIDKGSRWVIYGYFTSITSIFIKIIDEEVKDCDNVKQMLHKQNELMKSIKEIWEVKKDVFKITDEVPNSDDD